MLLSGTKNQNRLAQVYPPRANKTFQHQSPLQEPCHAHKGQETLQRKELSARPCFGHPLRTQMVQSLLPPIHLPAEGPERFADIDSLLLSQLSCERFICIEVTLVKAADAVEVYTRAALV